MTDARQTMIDPEINFNEPDDANESETAEKGSDTPNADDKPRNHEPREEKTSAGKLSPRRRVSISLRSLATGALITVLLSAIGTLAWLYLGAQHTLDAQARQSENNAHAEKIALDYAVNAAVMDAQDINAWKTKLVAGTTPELKEKLAKAANSMEQILVPLQWASTASPLVAKVRSNSGSSYIVDAFVSVQTKTVQAPDPLQSTAAYSITLDASKDWQISDVGGIGAVVGGK